MLKSCLNFSSENALSTPHTMNALALLKSSVCAGGGASGVWREGLGRAARRSARAAHARLS